MNPECLEQFLGNLETETSDKEFYDIFNKEKGSWPKINPEMSEKKFESEGLPKMMIFRLKKDLRTIQKRIVKI